MSDIEKYIGITFVGADQQWKSLVPNRLRNIDQLQIRPNCVIDWLEALQAVHPHFPNIVIDYSRDSANELTNEIDKLILHAEILSTQMHIKIDKFASERPENQQVVEDEEEEAIVENTEPLCESGTNEQPNLDVMQVHSSFLTVHPQNDQNEATRNVLKGLKDAIATKSSDAAQKDGKVRYDSVCGQNSKGLTMTSIDCPLFDIPV